jgi:hypothetical protein
MSQIKPSDHGIVVEHKETEMHFAVSDRNYNPEVHRKVRDLRPGESVITYRPRPKESLGELASPNRSAGPAGEQGREAGDSQ